MGPKFVTLNLGPVGESIHYSNSSGGCANEKIVSSFNISTSFIIYICVPSCLDRWNIRGMV